MTITEASELAGSTVTYVPFHGVPEQGVIRGCSSSYVFVLYEGDLHPKATAPELLTPGTMPR